MPSPFYKWTGIGLGAFMWLWIMYRAKQDGPVMLVRFPRIPFLFIPAMSYASSTRVFGIRGNITAMIKTHIHRRADINIMNRRW